MAVNKVVYGKRTIMDLTEDTVNEDALLEGYTAHNAAGEKIEGQAKKIETSIKVINNLESDSETDALSANMGKELNSKFPIYKHILNETVTLADYRTFGIYNFDGSCTISDIPAGSNGWLIVLPVEMGDRRVKQIWTRYGTPTTNSFFTYERIVNDNAVGAWTRFATYNQDGMKNNNIVYYTSNHITSTDVTNNNLKNAVEYDLAPIGNRTQIATTSYPISYNISIYKGLILSLLDTNQRRINTTFVPIPYFIIVGQITIINGTMSATFKYTSDTVITVDTVNSGFEIYGVRK